MTENCGVLTALGPAEHRRGGDVLRSAGRPVPGSIVSIQDPDGNILPPGETGEVCAKAGNYMREYWNRPDETKDAFRGGWYHTGDAGYMDAEGYVYLVDRVKDMIVTGGENVYSAEVENAIARHPAVAQCAVIGVPDAEWGERVHAVVVPMPVRHPSLTDLREHAKTLIAGYKAPRSLELVDALPVSGAGKILKRELRKAHWADDARQVH
jgi:acyl-CoA synthetase (AMP-forming)/AMP-acid ligase II